MRDNAKDWKKHRLVVVFDGTQEEYENSDLEDFLFSTNIAVAVTGRQSGVGAAKNLGAAWLWEDYVDNPARWSTLLMFSDNDMYYLPNWDSLLETAILEFGVTQLGGWRHPYHQFEGWRASSISCVAGEVDAVTGNCFVMRWKDWFKYGPFDANALGPGQSEDYALSQRIKENGGLVATLDPSVAIHCGLSNSLGEPAVGAMEMATLAESQIKEYSIPKIWLSVPYEGEISVQRLHKKYLNVGSGQRRFDTAEGWINVDCVSREGQIPDVVCDATRLSRNFDKNSQDIVVLHHVLEHFGCGEADEVIKQCWKVLKPGGSLLIFVPDMERLAGRWLGGEIDDYTFFVNAYGAFQGEDGDRHKWGYSWFSIYDYLSKVIDFDRYNCGESACSCEPDLKHFDWRIIPGADIAKDWWVLGVEVVKPL